MLWQDNISKSEISVKYCLGSNISERFLCFIHPPQLVVQNPYCSLSAGGSKDEPLASASVQNFYNFLSKFDVLLGLRVLQWMNMFL